MPRGISAYLTIYNDFDILPHTLRAIAPYVDELIVVDGAYEWMLPYLQIAGVDPPKSRDEVYDALGASGINYRIVQRLWRAEPEKRMAGYEACKGHYAFRIDADEIPFFDDLELDRFIATDGIVAQMATPTYINPQWVVALDDSGFLPLMGFLFDRSRIEPQIHLNYLWLVLGDDRLPSAGEQPFPMYEPKIGFNAHLNEWRDLQSQIRRGTFYWLQSIRRTGVPWIEQLRNKPLADLGLLFQETSPAEFSELVASSILLRSQIFRVLGWYSARSPLPRQHEALFTDRFDAMRAGRAALNRAISENGVAFCPGMPISLDLSSGELKDALTRSGLIRVSATCALSAVTATLHLLLPGAPWHTSTVLDCEHNGSEGVIRLPPDPGPYTYLRRELDITLSANLTSSLPKVRVGS